MNTLPRAIPPAVLTELKRYGVAALLIVALAINAKLLLVWGLFIFFYTVAERHYAKLPTAWRTRLNNRWGAAFTRLRRSTWSEQISEAVFYTRPYFLHALFLFVVPFAFLWMGAEWCRRVFRPDQAEKALPAASPEQLIFRQNQNLEKSYDHCAFYHKPAFALTASFFFVGGIPALFTYWLYNVLQIDAMLGYPSSDPEFFIVIPVICFYISSVCWCLATLFMRAWFGFPLNFLSREHDIIVNAKGVERCPYKGWFLAVLTMNNYGGGLRNMAWDAVDSVHLRSKSGMQLYPLPPSAFYSVDSPVYRFLNKIALFYDSVAHKINRAQYVTLYNKRAGFVQEMDINLSDLGVEERARFYYAIAKWAPSAAITPGARESLLGSVTLSEPKYTEIWFDLLTSCDARKRTDVLSVGESLRGGQMRVEKLIASGGQATAYLATYRRDLYDETPCVLKEFILSDSDAEGALIGSAREFEVESGMLGRLDHERIIKMIDFFAEDRRAYLVLEYARGKSLRQLVCDDGPLNSELVVEIAVQICEGVAYLHNTVPAIVHQDLAPDNVLYDAESGVKIIDFSLACSDDCSPGDNVVGKHAYMPPEQFRGEATVQSDIYTIGATMHFLLTGSDPRPLAQASPRKLDGAICERLNAIVERATELEPTKRFESVHWMLLELMALRDCDSKAASESVAA